jgi:hypothetical protein
MGKITPQFVTKSPAKVPSAGAKAKKAGQLGRDIGPGNMNNGKGGKAVMPKMKP